MPSNRFRPTLLACLMAAFAAPAWAQDPPAGDAPPPQDPPATQAPAEAPPAPESDAPEAEPENPLSGPEGTVIAPITPDEETPPTALEDQSEPPAEGAAAPEPATPGPAAPGQAAPGEQTGSGDPAEGEVLEVIRETFGDWEIRCAPEGADCFMYQLALDDEESPVAEVSILKLPEGSEAVAGATVVSPLGTLLTAGVVLQIDSGEQRQYPFTWCSQVGCFARFGLTQETIAAMKRGRGGSMTLVSVAAPDEPLALDLSLTGFTAAFDSLSPPAN